MRVVIFHPLFILHENIGRCDAISKDNLRINEEIRAREVRVVSASNEQLGVMVLREALRLAAESQLDLVEVAPLAKPPVCRMMDYGKYKYEQQKREKEAKKKQKIVTIKEVKVRPNIEDHDFQVKLKNAQRFLLDGDKVKATVMFRGRELSHPELGRQVLVRMAGELKEIANVERDAKLEGKNMIMILAAKQQQH
jgi:translation initiation factor IF-3